MADEYTETCDDAQDPEPRHICDYDAGYQAGWRTHYDKTDPVLVELRFKLKQTEAGRDGAYRERAQLLALLAAHYPAVLAPAPDVEEDGWRLLYVDLGGRQASWHIAPRDVALFAHVPEVAPGDPRAQWDGRTTEEKYQRIAARVAYLAEQCGPECAEGHTYRERCRLVLPEHEHTRPSSTWSDVNRERDRLGLPRLGEPHHPAVPAAGADTEEEQ